MIADTKPGISLKVSQKLLDDFDSATAARYPDKDFCPSRSQAIRAAMLEWVKTSPKPKKGRK